ncbi:MAG: GntR family transcriptional regulator [Methylobacteriaceae bacterium]|jgi:DNA-binding GntR family transcriptional regulator|nr:GntR family transcriptional regulator [Methylobacteriaceae bacterium]
MAGTLPAYVAGKIIEYVRVNRLPAGTHLGAQALADLFYVSRNPVRTALIQLAGEGIIRCEKNRGFFLAVDGGELLDREEASLEASSLMDDPLYYRLAEDWLAGRIEERISENDLMRHYSVARGQLFRVLQRAAEDLWVERLPGHGWRFLSVMVSQQAYEKGYRFRMAIEPAALLEPTFQADKKVLRELSERQVFLLKGGLHKLSPSKIFFVNSHFHQTLAGFSNNPFFVDALKKIDRIRLLLDFRSHRLNRDRLLKQCSEHLEIADLLEHDDNVAAAELMRNHLKGALETKREFLAGVPEHAA